MKIQYFIILAIFSLFFGCQKFLDEKPKKSLTVPTTLRDFQALLEKQTESQQEGKWGEISTDDFYYEDAILASKTDVERNVYLWNILDAFGSTRDQDWSILYTFIYHTNTVLEGLTKVERDNFNSAQWDRIQGEAFFFRAKCHLSVANIWAKGYNNATAENDLGIPIRLTTDFNEKSVRSSLVNTYKYIIDDLEKSISLLPNNPSHVVRPSKAAAMGLLARVYLFMNNYSESLKYADECLGLKNNLLNYNNLIPSNNYPFSIFNQEVIYHSYMSTSISNSRVNSDLINLYDKNDLRRELFFKDNKNGTFGFKGSYNANATLFSGIATDEVYLMRAECYARTGQVQLALDDLNTLLRSRWKNGEFNEFSTNNDLEVLSLILAERRKQLAFRGIRWPDVKRLNIIGDNIIMKRQNNGHEVFLQPNDPRFALPFPEAVIRLSGMPQNPQ